MLVNNHDSMQIVGSVSCEIEPHKTVSPHPMKIQYCTSNSEQQGCSMLQTLHTLFFHMTLMLKNCREHKQDPAFETLAPASHIVETVASHHYMPLNTGTQILQAALLFDEQLCLLLNLTTCAKRQQIRPEST